MQSLLPWLLKTLASIVLAAIPIWVGSFYIADYVAEKQVRGLTTAVETLSVNLSDLNSTVTSINANLSTQLISLERERANLALEIARELRELGGDQGQNNQEIRELRNGMERIEEQIAQIRSSMRIKYTFDGGKTFQEADVNEVGVVMEKLGYNFSDEFVLSPYQLLDPDFKKPNN
ncbi:hypothetical protein [Oricola cellulosilytica]|uniref:Uncharacterized protein n=1 Tax=Oricola cellulosilytica TaxID=1429082 RepID=A0A4R0PCB7_9HYPH|nr:hypothetical protein [Oricola cellulosilytica]TCD14108.1 hypothetical protein E0D97_08415 [Oricola cellulosilytica]